MVIKSFAPQSQNRKAQRMAIVSTQCIPEKKPSYVLFYTEQRSCQVKGRRREREEVEEKKEETEREKDLYL